MNSIRPIDLAIEFVERLNRRDFDGLIRIMAPNFRLGPGVDEIIDGPDESREALVGYTSAWPDFQIHISDVHVTGDTVVMVGRSTGSCENVPRGDEIREKRLYVAKMEGALVSEFRHIAEDTEAAREELGVGPNTRVTQ
ncbi:nuclear transport factor 2 family protein [bacterium]|nr:nuclear transport factor 2 family protein [bacterium]